MMFMWLQQATSTTIFDEGAEITSFELVNDGIFDRG
jgi:hypothetical protein